ncbi:MAG: hypothetical protein NXI14_06925, partial [bacterium]|nr:hypothetical protein [bacterium]
ELGWCDEAEAVWCIERVGGAPRIVVDLDEHGVEPAFSFGPLTLLEGGESMRPFEDLRNS